MKILSWIDIKTCIFMHIKLQVAYDNALEKDKLAIPHLIVPDRELCSSKWMLLSCDCFCWYDGHLVPVSDFDTGFSDN